MVESPTIRQRVGTERGENLNLVVRIAFTNVEYRRGKQDRGRALYYGVHVRDGLSPHFWSCFDYA